MEHYLVLARLDVTSRALCAHRLLTARGQRLGFDPAPHRVLVRHDRALCALYRDVKYHRVGALEKLIPTNAVWILRKACGRAHRARVPSLPPQARSPSRSGMI